MTEFHETEIGTPSYERTMAAIAQHLGALAKIGAQLEQLNKNLAMLRPLLEKQPAWRPPFRQRRKERRRWPPRGQALTPGGEARWEGGTGREGGEEGRRVRGYSRPPVGGRPSNRKLR